AAPGTGRPDRETRTEKARPISLRPGARADSASGPGVPEPDGRVGGRRGPSLRGCADGAGGSSKGSRRKANNQQELSVQATEPRRAVIYVILPVTMGALLLNGLSRRAAVGLMHIVSFDWAIIIAYFVIVLGIGYYLQG